MTLMGFKKQKKVKRAYKKNPLIRKADQCLSDYFKTKRCAVCNSPYNICGHHVVPKSVCNAFRYEEDNLIPLCPKHHKYSNDLAAHSMFFPAQKAFMEWLKLNFPKSWYLYENYKSLPKPNIDYEKAIEYWKRKGQEND